MFRCLVPGNRLTTHVPSQRFQGSPVLYVWAVRVLMVPGIWNREVIELQTWFANENTPHLNASILSIAKKLPRNQQRSHPQWHK